MIIIAKYNGKCSETGKRISIGEAIFWSKSTGKVYCKDSEKYKQEQEARNTSAYIQAQEDAYFDRFSYNNR
jgi:hypothetical protein